MPAGPIASVGEMLEHPQTVARNMVVETDHPTAGRVRSLGSAVKMSGTGHRSQSDAGSSVGTPSPAPLLGQHTREVLGDAGVSDERSTCSSPRACSSAQIPERPCKPNSLQDVLSFSGRATSPCGLHAPRVPWLNQRPHLLERHDGATWMPRTREPVVYVSFRPEGEIVSSGKADVVPGVPDRSYQMNDTFVAFEHSVANAEFERLAALRTV